MRSTSKTSINELRNLIRRLRRKCPWDKKQTFATLRPLLVEEAYELSEALGGRDDRKIAEELGDLLFMALFIAQIGEEKKRLRLAALVRKTVAKLKHRHPHVFTTAPAKNADEVLTSWERTKSSAFSGVPRALPALQKAQMIQVRAGRLKFEWKNFTGALEKVREEIAELEGELAHGGRRKIREELGDVLFALASLAGYLKLDAEQCLQRANGKFIRRFSGMEQDMRRKGKNFTTASLDEMEESWEEAKGRSSKNKKEGVRKTSSPRAGGRQGRARLRS